MNFICISFVVIGFVTTSIVRLRLSILIKRTPSIWIFNIYIYSYNILLTLQFETFPPQTPKHFLHENVSIQSQSCWQDLQHLQWQEWISMLLTPQLEPFPPQTPSTFMHENFNHKALPRSSTFAVVRMDRLKRRKSLSLQGLGILK